MSKDRIIGVVGLGYVGLPVAIAFGREFRTIGFDLNSERVQALKEGIDKNGEHSKEELQARNLLFTDQSSELATANFFIVAVPTPIDEANQPDLSPMLSASRTVGAVLKKGDTVVFESTVYPGVTEEECLPVLEKVSGLVGGVDFKVGYSPERINPGDKEHTFTKIQKIVSGQDESSLALIAETYGAVVKAGVFRAKSIRVAEAAKVIENTQRDLNIALMNELAMIFDLMGIETQAVLDAASTKWNFLKFTPGLVGGHCIGVDPYYLTHKAEKLDYIPQVILAGRRINDGMGKFVAQKTIKEMIRHGINIAESTVTVLGLTFKENCSDLRNSRVIDIIRELEEYGVKIQVCDPLVSAEEAMHEYQVAVTPLNDLRPSDAVILAVGHDTFRELSDPLVINLFKGKGVLADVKGIYRMRKFQRDGIRVWSL